MNNDKKKFKTIKTEKAMIFFSLCSASPRITQNNLEKANKATKISTTVLGNTILRKKK